MSAGRRPLPYKRGTRLNPASVGDRVSVTLVGQLVDYDADLGHWTLRGHSIEGHVTWEYALHWGTTFTPLPSMTPSALRIDAAAGGDGAPVGCLPPDPRPAAPQQTRTQR